MFLPVGLPLLAERGLTLGARRRQCVLLLPSLVAHNVNSAGVCCQTLLNLRIFAKDLVNLDLYGQKSLPPFLSDIPTYLCRTPAPLSRRKRRHRRRGKRGGRLVRPRAGWVRTVRGGCGTVAPLAGPCRCLLRTGGRLG